MKVLTNDEFHAMTNVREFNDYHGLRIVGWSEIFRTETEPEWYDFDGDKQYSLYLSWYSRTFTKLGRVLE